MLSGGTESVAALCYALEQGYDVSCYHTVFNDRSEIEGTYAAKICQMLDVPYHQIDYNIDDMGTIQIRDTWHWLGPAFIIAASTGVDELWYGVHKDDNIVQMEQIDRMWLDVVGLSLPLCTAKSKAPLYNLTKQEQWDMIDVDIKPLVVYCTRIVHEPCGECGKCKEWKTFVKYATRALSSPNASSRYFKKPASSSSST